MLASMKCRQYCTSGTDLPHSPPAVGRRAVYKRNLQFGCCDTDLCNNKLPSELTPTTCPSGTHEFKDGQVHVCYYLLKQERNADDGAKACADTFHGGKLAYIPSRAADEFIKSSLGSEFAGDHSGTFIGVFDKEHELSFVDTDGSPQVFFDLRHGQPNDPNVNDPIREPAQDCQHGIIELPSVFIREMIAETVVVVNTDRMMGDTEVMLDQNRTKQIIKPY
uniref:C-type lectin domain-containing protein n=1 Tax=Magallana gigas TaxID=29159 RepID=A0A8W8JAF8_MAGGI